MGLLAGGHAALWTGIVGPRYAPDLEISACGNCTAANIRNALAMNVEADKRFGPYLALSYSRSTLTSHSSKRFAQERSMLLVRS